MLERERSLKKVLIFFILSFESSEIFLLNLLLMNSFCVELFDTKILDKLLFAAKKLGESTPSPANLGEHLKKMKNCDIFVNIENLLICSVTSPIFSRIDHSAQEAIRVFV